ncbi:MAG: hypothetical protein DLM52_00205, partial [Chthoniobacterales bacterium]
MEVFDHEMEKQNGRPFRADDVNVAFLEVDNQIYKREIDDAVMHFVQNGAWPKLSVAQLRLLSLRAFMARGVLLALLDGSAAIGPELEFGRRCRDQSPRRRFPTQQPDALQPIPK